jgi:hypothetical protein
MLIADPVALKARTVTLPFNRWPSATGIGPELAGIAYPLVKWSAGSPVPPNSTVSVAGDAVTFEAQMNTSSYPAPADTTWIDVPGVPVAATGIGRPFVLPESTVPL